MFEQQSEEEWDDLLGTGTVMKQVLVRGRRWQDDEDDDGINMEAPRKFFALIDIDTRLHNSVTKEPRPVESECHRNFLINSDADLFAGAHLVIPLMDIHETSRYIFDSKFAYGSLGSPPCIPANCKLDCIITLKVRSAYDDFLQQMNPFERLSLAKRKKERGRFWFARKDYQMAISMYQTLTDICLISMGLDNETHDAEAHDEVVVRNNLANAIKACDGITKACGEIEKMIINDNDDHNDEDDDNEDEDEYVLAPEE